MSSTDDEPFYISIDGKWYSLSSGFLDKHPGGRVIEHYRGRNASGAFHAFHADSDWARKWLQQLTPLDAPPQLDSHAAAAPLDARFNAVNMGTYAVSAERADAVQRNFQLLRERVRSEGLMTASHWFYAWELATIFGLIAIALTLQFLRYYTTSALVLGLAWQQSGWQTHEYCHHQHFKKRRWNDAVSLLTGNVLQGFSMTWWKDKHNTHHAATNVVGKDDDIALGPLLAMVPADVLALKHKRSSVPWLLLIPYQHVYFWLLVCLIRVSWLNQSVGFVGAMSTSRYATQRRRAPLEAVTLAVHWALVLGQLLLLPDVATAAQYLLVSQLTAGFLIGYVVTYNHNSADKFSADSRILDNFAHLHLATTRNMRPSLLVNWLWGGLNFQIEHHLFPTMPRHSLSTARHLVKQFAADNELPYMEDDYLTGFRIQWQQLKGVGKLAVKLFRKKQQKKVKSRRRNAID